MVRVREGDVGALSILFDRHHRRLYTFCHRMIGEPDASEDMVQEVFLRTLRYRRTYRAGSNFSAWLLQITRNVVLAWQAKQDRERVVPMPDVEVASPDSIVDDDQRLRLRRLKHAPVERRLLLCTNRPS